MTILRVLTLLMLSLSPITSAADDVVTVIPREDEAAILHNPDMGWVLYENYPLDANKNGSSTLLTLPDETFAAVDTVAIMFSWQDIEKRPDEYDFKRADYAYDYWRKRNKQIQLRLSTESLLWWTRQAPPAGKGIPDYVLANIPPDKRQIRTCDNIPYTVVDARDPYYLDRLDKFLAAVAAHFSQANHRPVTLVDLRGFGLWGEWHSGYQYATLDDRRAALIGVIDRYAAAFKDNYLALSYSYDPDGPRDLYPGPTNRFDEAFTKTYDDFLRFSAFDHALTLPNVTFRRDGAGGAVHSNERKLDEQAFRTLAKGPMFCEFVDGYAASKKGKKGWVEWKIDDALSLHPNYVNLLGWQGADARDFMKERPDLIDRGLRTMGYRLVPTKIQYPARIRANVPFTFKSEWTNRAVGRAVRNYTLRLMLTTPDGKPIATADAGPTGCDKWIKRQSYPLSHSVTFRDVPPGAYDLCLSLIDPRTNQPIALPLAGAVASSTYKLGAIAVAP
ncbi:MAG TPA: hypothetical protein VH475_11285 [Tepidisphaeraceae bacterium]|jgi:hypothetical protein